MLNKRGLIALTLAIFLSITFGISNAQAQYFSEESPKPTVEFGIPNLANQALAGFSNEIVSLFDILKPRFSGLNASLQSGSSNGKKSAPEVTSNVEFLGMDYSTAITVLTIIFIILLVTLVILLQISGQLSKLVRKKESPEEEPQDTGLKKFFKGLANFTKPVWYFLFYRLNPTIGVLTVIGIIVVILMFNFYHRAQDLGTQIGYAPDQPVNFSHKLHAGQYNIDCQYCHTGVREGKNATIPSTNICMNCHNIIKKGPKYGSEEIKKVVQSFKNNEPIEWVRIHNLPDHVYFNHSQHVKVGNVECETCHGNVSNMEVVHQHAKLEMGWCIDCHRNRNIDASNDYYQKTFEFVDKHDKFTVADMGGTECQKCHY